MIPQRTPVAGVTAALTRQLGRGPVCVIADRLHGGISELHRRVAGVGHAHFVQAVLESHDAQADGAVAQIGVTRLLDGVVIDINHVVQHAHGDLDGALELVVVQFFPMGAIFQMAHQIHRTQVAHGSLGVRCVERDLSTQIGRVDHPGMLLRRAHIASIFEGDPRMTGFKQHREHLAPQIGGLHGARRLDLATGCLGFVGHIGCFKIQAKLVVQVGHIGWRKQRPVAFFHHAAHEQIRNPVGGVHVMGAAAVIAGVFAQLQKFLDVEMPCFQVGTDCALALAALVDCHGRVIDHFEEGHNPLRFAVGTLDARTQSTHTGPVVAQTASELGQQGVFLDGLVNPV